MSGRRTYQSPVASRQSPVASCRLSGAVIGWQTASSPRAGVSFGKYQRASRARALGANRPEIPIPGPHDHVAEGGKKFAPENSAGLGNESNPVFPNREPYNHRCRNRTCTPFLGRKVILASGSTVDRGTRLI